MTTLTDARVRSLKGTGKRYLVPDRNGLALRVGTTGKKSFVYTYREGRRIRWLTLGAYPGLTLADARVQHAAALKAREQGGRPADAVLELRRAAKEAFTIAELAAYYVEQYAKRQKSTWAEDQRLLKKDVIPRIGSVKARDVKRRDIIEILEAVADRGAPVTANRTLAVITKMFNFAVERELVPATPCAGMKRIHRERERDRVLTEEEVGQFWNRLDACTATEGVRLALRLMLVTGQRRAEVVEATWDEFDLAAGWWTIAEHRSKNRTSHRVPLSPLALELLKDVKDAAGESIHLFPSPSGEGPATGRAITRAVSRSLGVLQLANFTPHDLRRTVASHLAGMQTPRLVISKLLNHTDQGITRVYDRHSYDPEKKTALDAWAARLLEIAARNLSTATDE